MDRLLEEVNRLAVRHTFSVPMTFQMYFHWNLKRNDRNQNTTDGICTTKITSAQRNHLIHKILK